MKILKAFFSNKKIRIGIILLIASFTLHYSSDYMQSKDIICTVVDKIQSNGGYKSSGHFILILNDGNDNIFDKYVSASTYVQANKGDKITFTLRKFDIKQNPMDNAIYFFGFCILLSCAITFTVIGLFTLK